MKAEKQDPMSHRIIEKRRRDRMNNCLADLSRLIPSAYLKKGRGRIEKTEIIEMAIKHLKHLQAHACKQLDKCEVAMKVECPPSNSEQFRLGYQECMSETMHFLVEVEGYYAGDSLCVQLMNHLQKHCERITRGADYHSKGPENSSFTNGDGPRFLVNEGDKEMVQTPELNNSAENGFTECDMTSSEESVPLRSASAQPFGSNIQVVVCESELIQSRVAMFNDNMYGNGSQLREMLQNPHVPGSSRFRSRPISTSSSSSSRGEEVYKFKTNIKDRFHADQQHQGKTPIFGDQESVPEGDSDNASSCPAQSSDQTATMAASAPSPPMLGRASTPFTGEMGTSTTSGNSPMTTETKVFVGEGTPAMLDPTILSASPSSFANNGPTSPPLKSSPQTIPIFALHPRGNFYVPMTLDINIVAPFLNSLGDVFPVLHPVNIAVYFCTPIRVPEIAHKATEMPPMIRPVPSPVHNECVYSTAPSNNRWPLVPVVSRS